MGKATANLKSEFKAGTCAWCGDRGTVYADNGRCEQCDSDVFHCSICDDDQHADDLCRHVFRDSNFEWAGSGTGRTADDVRISFLKLLDLMPPGFGADLRKAIRSGHFHTWLIAPLIGGGGMLEMRGMPYEDGRKFGDALRDIGDGDNAEEAAYGYHWMVSLYDRKTLAANRVTVAWINKWEMLNRSVPSDKGGQ
jgi:hypothetical protein